jgi:hypothetical protein
MGLPGSPHDHLGRIAFRQEVVDARFGIAQLQARQLVAQMRQEAFGRRAIHQSRKGHNVEDGQLGIVLPGQCSANLESTPRRLGPIDRYEDMA